MGETTMLWNFTLSRDFVKQAVKQFTARKTIEVVHNALSFDPHQKENARPVEIMGPPLITTIEENIMDTEEGMGTGKIAEAGSV